MYQSISVSGYFSLLIACRAGTRKTINRNAKIETIKAFLPTSHEHVKGFLKLKSKCTDSRFVIGPSNTLWRCVCVHFSARKFYRVEE